MVNAGRGLPGAPHRQLWSPAGQLTQVKGFNWSILAWEKKKRLKAGEGPLESWRYFLNGEAAGKRHIEAGVLTIHLI